MTLVIMHIQMLHMYVTQTRTMRKKENSERKSNHTNVDNENEITNNRDFRRPKYHENTSSHDKFLRHGLLQHNRIVPVINLNYHGHQSSINYQTSTNYQTTNNVYGHTCVCHDYGEAHYVYHVNYDNTKNIIRHNDDVDDENDGDNTKNGSKDNNKQKIPTLPITLKAPTIATISMTPMIVLMT